MIIWDTIANKENDNEFDFKNEVDKTMKWVIQRETCSSLMNMLISWNFHHNKQLKQHI